MKNKKELKSQKKSLSLDHFKVADLKEAEKVKAGGSTDGDTVLTILTCE